MKGVLRLRGNLCIYVGGMGGPGWAWACGFEALVSPLPAAPSGTNIRIIKGQ